MSRKFVAKRRRTANGENKVTLFPFLAVLLCTMGALIMLLVVIARNVKEQSVTAAKPAAATIAEQQLSSEQATEILEQIKMGTEEAEWFAENLTQSKKEAEETLAEKHTQLALAEKETQKVHDEIKRLATLAEQLEHNEKTKENNVAELKSLLEQRKRQYQQEELELAELQKETAKDAKSYAIIPYRGTAGTYRRPIYIECRDNKVIIQPEGIELTEADFLFANRPDNPLDTVLRVIRQYYLETNQIVRGTEPYPLLVVRPSGVEAYEATRRAVGAWIQEFGYELVEEDSKIEYPKPSEELKIRIEKQLEISRYRLAGYLNAVQAEHSATTRSQQYRLDHRGNVLPSNNDLVTVPRNRQNNRNNNRDMERNGRIGGNSSAETTPSLSSNNYQESSGNSSSNPDPDISLIERRKNAGNNPIPDHSASEYPVSGNSVAGERNNLTQQNPAFGTQTIITGMPAPVGQPYGSEYFSQQQQHQQYSQQLQQTQQLQQPPKQRILDSESNVSFSDSATINSVPTNTSTNTLTNTPTHSNYSEYSDYSDYSKYSEPLKQPPPKLSGVPVTGYGAAANRVDNWALRDATPFASAVSRNIKIQCEANRYVLVPQTGLVRSRVVPITNSGYAAADKLVTAIWEFMDSWGIAGDKMYWRPVLQVKIMPGGEQRFLELKSLLQNSGIIIVNSE
ncbi:MAG: hypothetical protein LBF88_04360 [Planctomycetaceae bacterium]|jgi:hypothetical protein|nr:hypothetical protein [Planctomycetaceae bacterium]